jgi:hypothetical protein
MVHLLVAQKVEILVDLTENLKAVRSVARMVTLRVGELDRMKVVMLAVNKVEKWVVTTVAILAAHSDILKEYWKVGELVEKYFASWAC